VAGFAHADLLAPITEPPAMAASAIELLVRNLGRSSSMFVRSDDIQRFLIQVLNSTSTPPSYGPTRKVVRQEIGSVSQ
jgi:hypothetical protein